MKPVRYSLVFSPEYYNAYVHHEDDDHFYFVIPLGLYWLEMINKVEWIDQITYHSMPKDYVHMIFERSDFEHEIPSWISAFPLQDDDVSSFHHFVQFFEMFSYYQSRGLISALEESVHRVNSTVPDDILCRLVTYTVSTLNTNQTRLPILFHPQLSRFLKEVQL